MNLAVWADHRVKLKENGMRDEYLKLADDKNSKGIIIIAIIIIKNLPNSELSRLGRPQSKIKRKRNER